MSRTVLITGGSSGIGLGLANEFARAGHNLLINGLEKDGDAIAAGIAKEHGVKCIFHGANALNVEEIDAMFKLAEEKLGHVEVLVNCAGVQYVAPIEEFPESRWDLIIGVNLSGPWHATKRAWPNMQKNKWGRVINISSAHGLRASPFKSAYIASKHGVNGMTKCLALEGAEHGITVNSICPGYVRTPLVEGQIKDQAKAHGITEEEVVNQVMLKKHAIKEFVTVEQLAHLALFLASEHSATMTGAELPMEGGWVIQ